LQHGKRGTVLLSGHIYNFGAFNYDSEPAIAEGTFVTGPDPSAHSGVHVPPRVANADFPWDAFDSDAYFDHNYSTLRAEDRQIIDIVADFFQATDKSRWIRPRAIDVGAGTNLYPALAMLPFAAEVTLYELALANRVWLEREIPAPHPSWWDFWMQMNGGRESYSAVENPFDLLIRRAKVVRGNIFTLRPNQYDMGTMFFVAESITSYRAEFARATQSFVNSLRPGAPFAAAFMRESTGYRIGNRELPACPVNEENVDRTLSPVASGVQLSTVDSTDLRDGYNGMIVVTGRKKGVTRPRKG
jgi:hypothetical protein